MRTSFKKSLSIVLAILMLVSAFSVMGVNAADTDKSATGDDTIILDASFCEEGGSAEWYAWTWNDESDGRWVQAIGGTSAADITYDASEFAANVLFARMNPAKHDILPSWNTETDSDIVWNQTEDTATQGGTFVIDSWGEGWGAKLTGHWEGGEPDVGEYTVKLNPGPAAGSGDWYAWTWIDKGAHWVSGTEENGIYTFNEICDNVIFACFNEYPDNQWTGKIGQTTDLYTENGQTYYINEITEAEDLTALYLGEWGPENTEPETTTETEPETTTAPETEPETTTAPDTGIVIPTDPTAADEDKFLYVSAKSNVNNAGSKVKISGDTITVSYNLKVPEKLDDGQFTVMYDSSKLELSPTYNTASSMFPVVKDAQYNLGAGAATIKFNFSSTGGKYDFTNGGTLINLVFTRKSADTVGTAYVYLIAEQLDSKDTIYIDNSEVRGPSDIITPNVSEAAVIEPTDEEVIPASNPKLIINASSNISSNIQKISCTQPNVKVTYKMTAPELIAYGRGIITYDSSKLALEAKYNPESSMFTTLDNQVVSNLNAGSGTMMFNFTSVNAQTQSGTYDFTKGGEVISLVFTLREGAEGDTDVHLDLMELGSFSKTTDTDYVSDGKATDNAKNLTVNVTLEPQSAPVPTEETTGDTNPSDTTSPDSSETTASTDSTETTTAPATTAPVSQPATTAPPASTAPTTVKASNNVGKGTSVAAADKFVKALKNDNDPKGSVFNSLKAKAVNPKKTSVKVTWSKISGAKGYIVYGNRCGKSYKKLKTVTGKSFTQKKLKKGTYYKYLIMAYDKNNKIISTSKTIHVATKGGKVGNYKKVKLNKNSKTLKKGKTFKLKATCVKESKKLKVKNHRKVKYESTNTKIATVSAKGKIKAKKKGTCKVYAYAQNGVSNVITIKVK